MKVMNKNKTSRESGKFALALQIPQKGSLKVIPCSVSCTHPPTPSLLKQRGGVTLRNTLYYSLYKSFLKGLK